jgi:TolA-binding protein
LADKDYGQAAKFASEIVDAKNNGGMTAHALYLQARVAMAQQNWAGLKQPLERLLKEYPNDSLAFSAKYWLAEGEYRQGHYQAGAEQFALLNDESAGRTEKWLPMIPLRQAQALAQLGEWSDALTIARKIKADSPQFEQLYEVDYVIGRALASQADFVGARNAYSEVIRSLTGGKTETAAMAQWMIGETYFHQENYQAAVREYLRVEILYAYPRWQAGALLQAGKCHESLGQWKEAAELYARLIRVYPRTEFTVDAQSRLRVAEQHVSEVKRKR